MSSLFKHELVKLLLEDNVKDFIRYPKQFFQIVAKVNSSRNEQMEVWEVQEVVWRCRFAPELSVLRTYKVKVIEVDNKKSDTDADNFMTRPNFKRDALYLLDVTGSISSKMVIPSGHVPDVFMKEMSSTTLLTQLSIKTANHEVIVYLDGDLATCLVGDTVLISYVQLFMDKDGLIKSAASPISELTVLSRTTLPADTHPRVIDMTYYGEYDKVVEDLAWNRLGSPPNTYFITSCTPGWLIRLELSATPTQFDAKLICTMNDGSCGFLSILYDHNVAILLNIQQKEWDYIRDVIAKERRQLLITKNRPDEEVDPLSRLLMGLFTKASMSHQRRMKMKALSTDQANDRMVPYRVCVDRGKNHWATFHTSTHDSLFVKIVTIQNDGAH